MATTDGLESVADGEEEEALSPPMDTDTMEAIALTKKMDALFRARDMDGLKTLYHPNVESTTPNGGTFKGAEANFAGLINLAKMFPDMVYTSFNFRRRQRVDVEGSATNTVSCTFDTTTECNNPGPQPPANSVYKVVKTNTFQDGLLVRVEMGATQASVLCKPG
jgi:SnoaL-like domain